MLKEGFSAESAHVAKGGGVMQRGDDGVMGCWRDVHSSLIVKVSSFKRPIHQGGAGEQGGALL